MGIIKNLIGRIFFHEELAKLNRYQQASALAWRWNGEMQQSAYTARWISEVGEGKRGADISEFREDLRAARKPYWMDPDSLPSS